MPYRRWTISRVATGNSDRSGVKKPSQPYLSWSDIDEKQESVTSSASIRNNSGLQLPVRNKTEYEMKLEEERFKYFCEKCIYEEKFYEIEAKFEDLEVTK
ncbi:hypothetical protein NPIL_681761 [Nephila pilipes]|uniref:Uncharacterized protein n=1 Tax=Nephila pilipes TaxID=299642 RepID=A0A8X6PU79_NEPPI|nr:hypothetical protein NPIL_681761 [Nephila pilipes]